MALKKQQQFPVQIKEHKTNVQCLTVIAAHLNFKN